jgi:SAM-dependent methyltransferase
MDSTTRFTGRAGDYAKYRPSYPPEAIAAVLDGFTAPHVADLGAGTGISSALLADAGAHVVAVEPNAQMRAAIVERPNITVVDGTAEATALPNGSVDVVTAFQAYHWFDPPRVIAEAARIGKTRVRFAAVWNERDESDAFTGAYSEIIRAHFMDDTEKHRRGHHVLEDLRAAGWSDVRVVNVQQMQELDWEGMIGRARSTSYLPREGPAYEAMAAQLRELYDRAAEYGGAHFVLTTGIYLGERQ